MSYAFITSDAQSIQPLVARLKAELPNILVNHPPGAEDVVLFCVWATEGPTPGTREAYNVCRGIEICRWAVLLCDTEKVDDKELHRVVSLSAASILAEALGEEIEPDEYHDLRDNQPDLVEQLQAIARAPGRKRLFQDATNPALNALAMGRASRAGSKPWWKFW